MKTPLLLMLIILSACSKPQKMRTGFYFLTTSDHGVKMQEEGSNKSIIWKKHPLPQ